MKGNIRFREIQRSDYTALEKIISDTWGYEQFCSHHVAKRLSKVYLASCLANQTFTCVAENNGEVVGIIMGKYEKKHRTHVRLAIGQFFAIVGMLRTKAGRQVAKMYGGIDKLDKALLVESKQTFDAELAFFAIRADQRGTGIGNELFNRLLVDMRTQKVQDFYLFTDSSCNFGFYEHQGMARIGEKKFSLKPYLDEEMQFYLYSYHMVN
ncbi:GNAT family N-acetyltransferase [Paenibacillus sp. CMAA1364]